MAIDLAKRGLDSARDEAALLADIGDYEPLVPSRVVVVAPHPDDEVLGLGGFLSRCGRVGTAVEMVAVTDGERAYGLADLEARNQLVLTRARERDVALRALGLAPSRIHRLAIADGAVADSEQALSATFVEVLSREATPAQTPESTVLVAPWCHDLHPDHEAVGRAAVAAAATVGCQMWEVPIWSWYHLGELETSLPLSRVAKIALSISERTAKRLALSSFHSQSHPPAPYADVLPVDFLSMFDRDFEIVLR
jgi:LmbE family N-acetylglucosaminyl deacetylase